MLIAVLINLGDAGETFFILEKGVVTVKKGSKTLIELKGGDYFGEIALLEDSARQASILAKGMPVDNTCEQTHRLEMIYSFRVPPG